MKNPETLLVLSDPTISTARLPVAYEAAKTALAQCSRLDECKDWADKAEALRSYARQARDDSLLKMATRIKGRAINRSGELLKQIPPGTGTHMKKGGDPPLHTREQAAAAAGMSDDQRKDAIRIANYSESDPEGFEELLESDTPPTITELARRGTKAQPKPLIDLQGKDPEQFKVATQALGVLREAAEFAANVDPQYAAGGLLDEREVNGARSYVHVIDAWLDRFITTLE